MFDKASPGVFIPQRRFFRLSEGSHWFEWLSFPCLVVWKFSHPTTHITYQQDGRTGRGRIYLWKFLGVLNWFFFWFLFLNVFSYQGERFFKKFWCQRGNFRARRSKMDPKIDTFCQVDTRVLAILGVEKVVFWTFSKLFWSCLGSV